MAINQRQGNCYQLAGRYVAAEQTSVLLHVTLFSPVQGQRMGHALVEVTPDIIWEPVTEKFFLKEVLFAAHEVEEDARYTSHQVNCLILTSRHWGPWEKEAL